MITLDGILENIVAELLVIVVSLIVSKLVPTLIHKDKIIKTKTKFDILSVSIFLTLVSVLNLILNLSFWNNSGLTIFLVLSSFALAYFTYYIYDNQCPSCKKLIRAKKRIDSKIIRRFTRDYKYQPMKVFLYSNGEVWKKKQIGKEKIRKENWLTKQEFYECRYCEHKWDSGQFDINLDEKTRPKPEIVNIDKRDSNSAF